MENNLNMGHEFDWNSEIQNDSPEFELLPEGDYDFVVKSFERGRHNGSEKLPPCNKAILKIELTDGEHTGTITHNLMLHTKTEGLICAFFTAIGHRRKGEKLRMDWNRVVGSRGRCRVGVRTYKSTKTGEDLKINEIRRFLEPEEAAAPAPQAAAPQQQSFAGGFGSGFGGGFKSGFGGGR